MKKISLAVLLIISFCFCSTLNFAFALDPQWKLVVRVKGEVQSQLADQAQWNNIWQSRMLKDGDKTRTLADSRAKIRLSDQTVFTIGENTIVEMSQFKLTKDSRFAAVKLISGKLRVQVGKFFTGKSEIKVETPSAVLAARGTDFFIDQKKETKQAGGNVLTLIVFDGVVGVTTGTQSLSVNAGQMLTIGVTGSIMVSPASIAPGVPVPIPGEAQDSSQADSDLTVDTTTPWTTQEPGSSGAPATEYTSTTTGTASQSVSPTSTPVYNPSSSSTGSLPVVIQ